MKNLLSKDHFETVIHGFIMFVSSLSPLKLVQNAPARLLTETRRESILLLLYPHCTGCRPILEYILIYIYIFFVVFKCLNGLPPADLSELLHLHSPSRSLRSAHQLLLDVRGHGSCSWGQGFCCSRSQLVELGAGVDGPPQSEYLNLLLGSLTNLFCQTKHLFCWAFDPVWDFYLI